MAIGPEDLTKLTREAEQCLSGDLPVAVYAVLRDGTFVDCNKRLRKLLGLAENGPLDASLSDFYADGEKRKEILARLANSGCGAIENETVELDVDGLQLWVKLSCRPVWHDDVAQKQEIGYVGCMTDITDEESFREHSPVGMYELDAESRIRRANGAILKVLGYKWDELRMQPVSMLYRYSDKADELKTELLSAAKSRADGLGIVTKRRVELVGKDDTVHVFWANAFKVPLKTQEYEGRQGVLIDMTSEERMQLLLGEIPVGAYVVRYEIGDDGGRLEIIDRCNRGFAEMFGFVDESDAKGKDVRFLWQDHSRDAPAFEHDLFAAAGTPIARIIRLQSYDGERRFLGEVYGRMWVENGVEIGRIGAIRDVSRDISLIKMRKDVGKVLHEYLANLVGFRLTLDPSLTVMREGTETSGEYGSTVDDWSAPILRSAAVMQRHLLSLVGAMDECEAEFSVVEMHDAVRLRTVLNGLRSLDEDVPRELWDTTLLVHAMIILDVLRGSGKYPLPRESIKEARKAAQRAAQLCCAAMLTQVRSSLASTSSEILAFREYVSAPELGEIEAKQVLLDVEFIVKKAIEDIGLFPNIRGVDVRWTGTDDACRVKGSEQDLARAIYNLLHNAIKYSWSRERGQRPWVTVKLESGGGSAFVKIENYGVPIRREEITDDTVFAEGRRGEEAPDRGRSGLGLGLWVAREIARSHGGDVTIRSHPAWRSAADDDYSVPFLTTATLRLPLGGGHGTR